MNCQRGSTLSFCQLVGLLPLVKVCDCGHNMELENWNGCVVNGKHWLCTHRPCRKSTRLRQGTFFADLHLSLQKLVHFMYLYSIGCTKQADLKFHLSINSAKCIVKWKGNIRGVYQQYLIDHPQAVGGLGHTVETDKCVPVRRKYHAGHQVQQQ